MESMSSCRLSTLEWRFKVITENSFGKSWIFDFGSNEGRNLGYFLLKADHVVAIEANPSLNNQVRKEFCSEISSGRLFVEECLVSSRSKIDELGREQVFYVNSSDNLISSIEKPAFNSKLDWYGLRINCKTSDEIILKYVRYGDEILYCKFDLEGFDNIAVKDMLAKEIFPVYLSLELNDPKGLRTLIESRKYRSFKLSTGFDIGRKIRKVIVNTLNGKQEWTFEVHSSGPLFDDLDRRIFTARGASVVKYLKHRLIDWTDLHAARFDIKMKVSKRYELQTVSILVMEWFTYLVRAFVIVILPEKAVTWSRRVVNKVKSI